MEHTVCAM